VNRALTVLIFGNNMNTNGVIINFLVGYSSNFTYRNHTSIRDNGVKPHENDAAIIKEGML
jgi:hypothetical protein